MVTPIHPLPAEALASWHRGGPWLVDAPPAERSGEARHLGRTLRRAWSRAGVPRNVWSGRPLHSLRAGVRTHLASSGVHPDVIDALLGHAGAGTGARHYTDRSRLWPLMVEAVATIPPHPRGRPKLVLVEGEG